jgi:hypothetical protein
MGGKMSVKAKHRQLLIYPVIILLVSACGPSERPTEAAPVAATEAPTAVPATSTTAPAETAISPLVEPTPTDTPPPTPTVAPTATRAETTLDTAGNPDLNFAQVLFVRATQNSDGRWKFDTTVRHNDEGWDHYADAWQVLDLDGNLLAERILTHPHDTEQPFTRSQSNIDIPPEITQVIVRAKCNVHGFGGQVVLVDLTAAAGENFEVTR